MKKLARILCLLLALLMLVSVATAEDLGTIYRQHFGSEETELPITTEDITIDVWRGFSSTVMDTLADCETFKKMEEVTGVKINWVYPPVGSETDNFNLRGRLRLVIQMNVGKVATCAAQFPKFFRGGCQDDSRQ